MAETCVDCAKSELLLENGDFKPVKKNEFSSTEAVVIYYSNGEITKSFEFGREGDNEAETGVRRIWRKLISSDGNYRKNILLTLSIYYNFMLLGWWYGQIGAAFPDIQIILKTSLQRASLLFALYSLGYMIGGFIFGLVYDRSRKLLLLGVIALCKGATLIVLPWLPNYYLFMGTMLVFGIFGGGQYSGDVARLLASWGSESRQLMQGMYMMYALGGIIAPILTTRFLASAPVNNNVTYGPPATSVIDSNSTRTSCTTPNCLYNISNNISKAAHHDAHEDIGETKVYIAFTITGIMLLISGILFLILFCLGYENLQQCQGSVNTKKSTSKSAQSNKARVKMDTCQKVIFLVLLVLCIVTYGQVECKLQAFLMPFVMMEAGWAKEQGAFLISLCWAAFGFGRLSGILVSKLFSPATIMFFYLILTCVSCLGIYVGAVNYLDTLIWVSAPLTGFALSIVFPTLIVWTNENGMCVNGKMSGCFLFFIALGFMIDPFYIGTLMEQISPLYYSYLQVSQSVLSLLCFSGLYFFIRCIRSRKGKQTSEKGVAI